MYDKAVSGGGNWRDVVVLLVAERERERGGVSLSINDIILPPDVSVALELKTRRGEKRRKMCISFSPIRRHRPDD